MPAFMSHWLSDKHAHAWPCATTHKQELARPATEADVANWAAELLALRGIKCWNVSGQIGCPLCGRRFADGHMSKERTATSGKALY
jgi:hypothetical protein